MNLKTISIIALLCGGLFAAWRLDSGKASQPGDTPPGVVAGTPDSSTSKAPDAIQSAHKPAVAVNDFLKNPRDHAGPVVLAGRVSQAFPDRGAFVIVDAREAASCCETGCAENSVPVRVDRGSFTGIIPQVGEHVRVVGTVFTEDVGYRLTVQEVIQDK